MCGQLVLVLRGQRVDDFLAMYGLEALEDQGIAAAEIADHIASRTAGGNGGRPRPEQEEKQRQ